MASLAVIIPVFNEEENLPLLIPSLRDVLIGLNFEFRIIVVDDKSTD
jgi:glycosyltransferase involved in cell wall biosynthesis